MYAIVDIAGQQFKVEEGKKIFVHRLSEEEGKSVKFDKVLLIDDDKAVKVGEPTVKGASVSAKIISHLKGDKVIVFKKKRRKGYKVKNGYRDYLTQIEIEKISAK
jgi:large subunit ribosomal protein L21